MQKAIRYLIALSVCLVVCVRGNAAQINSVVVWGDQMTITGSNLGGPVTFGGQPTTKVKNTATQIVVTLQSAPAQGTYHVTVGTGANRVSAFAFVTDFKAERWESIRFQCGGDGVCNFINGVPLASDAELVLLRQVHPEGIGSYTVIGDGGNATISFVGHTFTFSLNKGVLGLPNKSTETCTSCGPFTLSAIVLRKATPRVIVNP